MLGMVSGFVLISHLVRLSLAGLYAASLSSSSSANNSRIS
jgi:hypothetical protein